MKEKMAPVLLKLKCRARRLTDNQGSDYVSTLIKILIAVVVGALLLGLMTALVNALWPELTQRIFDMFTGGGSTASGASTSAVAALI